MIPNDETPDDRPTLTCSWCGEEIDPYSHEFYHVVRYGPYDENPPDRPAGRFHTGRCFSEAQCQKDGGWLE